ncbi:MAG TPA: tRNA (adenosine(37)-N6)-threonylcarbamoyltransferase complex dimerization subunit type 1 TsaB [Chthonomonadaceae bacterium]|nr:tRNA (adenosine(37)-N6)-threonylcarbamoyltransferase complex dimerization subunit type 1 TsaB [Chthonomonadaceae bacterium]
MRQAATPGLLLALETSGDVCSVAVQRGDQFVAEHRFRHGMHLSERLMGHVDAVLKEAEATLEEVTAFAVGIGPGSFTGTRIGVMTVKTLAAVTGKPLFGVSGLEALAAEFVGIQNALIAPVLPCRTGVVFTALFAEEGEAPRSVTEPAALSLDALSALILEHAPSSVVFCGPAALRYEEALRAALAESSLSLSFVRACDPGAAQIAWLASRRLAAGLPSDDPFALVPLYIAPPPITLPKRPPPSSV